MTCKPITEILARHGIAASRMIAQSKSGYCRRRPNHVVILNSKVFTRRALILRETDLDLTMVATPAREAGENVYVLYEMDPHPFWKPGSMPIRQAFWSATWWTRTHAEDQDVFASVDSARPRLKRLRLTCVTRQWQGRAANSVACRKNDGFYSANMAGADVKIASEPPPQFRIKKSVEGLELSQPPSYTRGRAVLPVSFQRSGLLEYVWFYCGLAMHAVLFDHVVCTLGSLNFTVQRDHRAIHIRRDGQVIGLIWPCSIGAPEVVASARQQLGLHAAKDAQFP